MPVKVEDHQIQIQEDNALYRRGEPELVLTVVCRARPQPEKWEPVFGASCGAKYKGDQP
jgi:hypothetical protein